MEERTYLTAHHGGLGLVVASPYRLRTRLLSYRISSFLLYKGSELQLLRDSSHTDQTRLPYKMSNAAVGGVYAKIIQDVLEASQVDFEEGGVDQSTLDKLRKIWQDKLSSIRVAQFPWDPTPPPATQPAQAQAQAPVKPQPPSATATPTPTPPTAPANIEPQIKTESSRAGSQTPSNYNSPQLPANSMANMTAQQRAAAALQQKFGQQAAPQISQLQGQSTLQHRQGTPSSSYQNGQNVKPPLSTMQQMQQAQQRPSLPNNQTDGSGDALQDWKMEVARRRADAAAHPGEGDSLLKEHFLALQQRMEGGGLLMPLEERYQPRTSARRKVHAPIGESQSSTTAAIAGSSVAPKSHSLQQFDGVDDDSDDEVKVKDDEDEDAINSDLDDPDEIAGDPEADADTNEAMLCTYDKVQRVKNKWKCTLKDGILKVDGKEYVFHKGQGEFEW